MDTTNRRSLSARVLLRSRFDRASGPGIADQHPLASNNRRYVSKADARSFWCKLPAGEPLRSSPACAEQACGGKVVKHRDVLQVVSDTSKNASGLF